MNRKHFLIFLIVLHAVFFVKQVFVQNTLLQDSKEYLFAADNLIQKQTLYAWNLNHAYNEDWLTKRPILYPLILTVFKFLSFGSDKLFFILLYLVQNCISIYCMFLVLKILDKLKISIRWPLAVLYLSLSFSQYIYSNMVMSEIWLQLCMVGILYLLLCKPDSTIRLLQIGFLIVAGMLLKPVFQFAAIILPIAYLIFHFKRYTLQRFSICLIPIVFFLSVSYINLKRTGYFHYSSISTINLLHYNTYTTMMYKFGVKSADSIIDQIHTDAQIKPTYKAEQLHIQKECTRLLKENLGTYAFLHMRGIVFCLIDPGRFDFTQFFGLPHSKNLLYESNQDGAVLRVFKSFLNPLGILLGVLLVFNAFRALNILIFPFRKNVGILTKIIILSIPAYILLLTGPIGTSRFFMPLIPIIFLIFTINFKKKTE